MFESINIIAQHSDAASRNISNIKAMDFDVHLAVLLL